MHDHSPPEAKIALFRLLFRGRGDVYARRFESRRTGRAGYQPVCGHEWVEGLCEKPRVECSACPHQRFLPVTEDVVRWHLLGADDRGRPFVMGVYPMLEDETCHFLAVDFDGEAWRADAGALRETCRRLQVSAALERSRSGQGGHVWFFFTEAVPAELARNLGAYLASVRRLPRARLEALVGAAAERGSVLGVRAARTEAEDDPPWTAPPSRRRPLPAITGALPSKVEVVLGDQIY